MFRFHISIIIVFIFCLCLNSSEQNSVVGVSKSDAVTTTKDYILKNVFNLVNSSGDKEVPFVLNSNVTRPNDDDSNDENLTSGVYQKTFVDYFYEGVNAYLANDWESCIDHMERSLNLYRNYYDTLSLCRIQCEFERNRHKPKSFDYDHMHFFERLLIKLLCLERCRQRDLSTLPKWFIFDLEQKNLFKNRRPYEYLHICYYKDGSLDKAIDATYTALIVNREDSMLKKSLKFYIDSIDFDANSIKDMEEKPFQKLYLEALAKYKNKEWNEAIDKMETTLDLWLKEHDKCRAFCEGGFYQNFVPDFVSSISNYYVYSLRCKQNCTTELSFVNGQYYDDFYPSMYDYLQFSYFKVGNLVKATKCVSSYLLFYPNSEDMKDNQIFYQKQTDITEIASTPRKEAVEFYERNISEINLLELVDEEFSKLMATDTTLGGNENDDFR